MGLMCKLLEVSERGLYAWRRRPKPKHQERDEVLTQQIKVFRCGSRMSYGSPRIHRELKARGEQVGQKRVARLMRQNHLRGRCKGKFKTTTKANPKRQTVPNLLNQGGLALPGSDFGLVL